MFWNSRGTHWKSLYHDDRELYELVYWEIAKAYPELDDPEDAPAAIPVVYGTRIGELTLDLIDAEAVSMFGWGYCAYLALAVHDLTGEPLVLFTSERDSKNWSGHAAVRIGEDLYLDITGTRDFASIKEEYRLPEHAEPEVLSRAEFCERVTSSEALKENPYRYLDPIELKLLHHFAGLVNGLR